MGKVDVSDFTSIASTAKHTSRVLFDPNSHHHPLAKTSETMSTAAGDPEAVNASNASPSGKGKGKAPKEDVSMEVEDDEEDEDDDDDDDAEEDSDDEVEEDFSEINPEAITSRRTRGKKVDYTSAEALAKAGLTSETADDDDDDEMKS
ncbi:hypothetical protein ONZ45_g7001 [Pleurotus djamor]|nr:hypothetical protein ONZ45_g7001 [Pleurotus djamor]